MQEQVPSNITPEQGWSQMKSILDREMPVQRKSRRMITWWRSLMAVGLLTALSLTAYNTFNKVEPQQQQQQPAQPPVQQQPTVPVPADDKSSSVQENSFAQATEDVPKKDQSLRTTQADQQQDNNKGLASKHPFIANNKTGTKTATSTIAGNASPSSTSAAIASKAVSSTSTSTSTSTSSSSSSSSSENSIASNAASRTNNTSVEPGSVVAQESATVDATSAEHSKGDNQSTSTTADIAEAATATAQRNGQVTDAIPSLQADALVTDESGAIDMNIIAYLPVTPIKPVKQGGRILEGYVAGSGMAGFNKGGAWQAGAGMSLRLMPKVRLSGGASYREYSPDFSIGSLAMTEQTDAADVPIVNLDPLVNEGGGFVNDYVLNAGTTYESLEPLVKTLRQWQVDASITCDIGKRWFVQGGASYAVNTTAVSNYPILEDAYLANPYELRFTNELENYGVLREHMVTLHGGIGYHLGKNWDLFVQADHGLQPYLLSETVLASGAPSEVDRSDYIRGLTLGVRYRVL
jgi:hypothetical protein